LVGGQAADAAEVGGQELQGDLLALERLPSLARAAAGDRDVEEATVRVAKTSTGCPHWRQVPLARALPQVEHFSIHSHHIAQPVLLVIIRHFSRLYW
jgi:hypothetical protein